MSTDQEKIKINLAKNPNVVLMGNPNVGKSIIFSYLTGQYVTVSNYPGTTVEISRGKGQAEGHDITVTDAPGVYSLIPYSEDEKVARDVLLNESPQTIVNVVDAKNLRRALILTLQISEMDRPFLLSLNMIDEARQKLIDIDKEKLSQLLGVPVFETVAPEKIGLHDIKKNIFQAKKSTYKINYGPKIEDAISEIYNILPDNLHLSRGIILMFLSYDESIEQWLRQYIDQKTLELIIDIRTTLQKIFARNLAYVIAKIRIHHAKKLADQVTTQTKVKSTFFEKLGNLCVQPLTGIPILLFILYLMYKLVGEFSAQTVVGFLEETVFNSYIHPWLVNSVEFLIPFKIAQEYLIGEYGVLTVTINYAFALILPILLAFFLFFSILEDSGYLPRLAILLNRIFRAIGLSGKAIIPMVLGLGCDTMATMTTRILDTKKERIIATLLLALAIPCSAQLGVILGMAGSVSANALLVWFGVVLLVLVVVGYLASILIPGDNSDFILEIPPPPHPEIDKHSYKNYCQDRMVSERSCSSLCSWHNHSFSFGQNRVFNLY